MPLPTVGEECAVAFQVVLVDISLPMPRAVVLVYPPCPVDPQVGTSYEAVPLVEDLLLRGHRNLSCLVQHSHDRLPSGLAPRIEQRDDLSQQRCTAPPLTGRDLEAESPRRTRSRTPRSRAAARIVSAAVVIRSPLTRFIGNDWVWRHTSSRAAGAGDRR
jgi:hypothetical protein